MDKFVARENIKHFRDRLETETNPATRLLLDKLLIAELDKLGRDEQLLREIEGAIASSKLLLNRQQTIVAAMERDGRDKRAAIALLNGLSSSLVVHEDYRQLIFTTLHGAVDSAFLKQARDDLLRQSTFEEAVAMTLEVAIKLVGAPRGNVQLVAGDKLLITENHGFAKPFLNTFREVRTGDGSACGRAFEQRQPVVVPDVTEDVEYIPFRGAAAEAGYRAVVTAPIVAPSDHLLGFVSTHFANAHRPSPIELERLNSFCSMAADHLQLLLGTDNLVLKASRMQASVYVSA